MAETKKKTIKEYLDNLVDDEGLKSDITITITDKTLFKLAGTLFITATAITVMVFGIRAMLKSEEKAEH
jgi:hypothetical protein